MKPYGTRYQIVMVDDGTDDSTAEVAEVAAGQQPVRFLGVSATADRARALRLDYWPP